MRCNDLEIIFCIIKNIEFIKSTLRKMSTVETKQAIFKSVIFISVSVDSLANNIVTQRENYVHPQTLYFIIINICTQTHESASSILICIS